MQYIFLEKLSRNQVFYAATIRKKVCELFLYLFFVLIIAQLNHTQLCMLPDKA